MSKTKPSTMHADKPPRKRKQQSAKPPPAPADSSPKLSTADTLAIFQSGLGQCQEHGIQFKIINHPDGILMLMLGVDLKDGILLLRDSNA